MDQIVLIETIQIVSSPLNPRKVVDQNSIIELAESIKSIGLLQPVTIRPKIVDDTMPENNVYELVLGSRRLAAMRLNGEEHILAIVKDMNDDEVLEAMIIENLQRKDIEPLDEAKAFKELYDKGIEYIDIASKVGKSPLFVKLRITLNNLIPEFQLMLSENRLSLSHAFELCKVVDEIQFSIYEQHYSDYSTAEQDWNKLSLPELREKLSKQFLSLDTAEFDKHECIGCKYNTTTIDSLFAEYNENNCTNISCYHTKKQAHIIAIIKENIANDVPIMCKAGAEKTIAQLKELGVEEPILYLSSQYDLSLYPETDDEDEINNYDAQSVAFGYTRAFTVGMVRNGCKYIYFKEKEKNEPIVPVEDKVHEIKTNDVIIDAQKDEINEIERLKKKDLRNKELALEKAHIEINKSFKETDYIDRKENLEEFETVAFLASVMLNCHNPKIKEISNKFDNKISYLDNVSKMTLNERNLLKRCFIKEIALSSSVNDKSGQSILYGVFKNFYSDKFNSIVEDFKEKYEKQKNRILERIETINGKNKK